MRLVLLMAWLGACGGGPSIPGPGPGDDDDEPPPVDGGGGTGRLSFDWEITISGSPAQCSDVGAIQVEIVSMNLSDGSEDVNRIPCASTGTGFSNQLPVDTYMSLISLLDSEGLSILTQGSNIESVTNGGTTNLGLISFSF